MFVEDCLKWNKTSVRVFRDQLHCLPIKETTTHNHQPVCTQRHPQPQNPVWTPPIPWEKDSCFPTNPTAIVRGAKERSPATVLFKPFQLRNLFSDWNISQNSPPSFLKIGCWAIQEIQYGCRVYSSCYFSVLSKNESRLIKSPACLCVCVCVCLCAPTNDFWTDPWTFMKFRR
jgi:hypothetical protein